MRTVLFHRKFRRFHGGHLKVWHYFNHVLAAPEFTARVVFDANSAWDDSNPWHGAREFVIETADEVVPGALFVAGRDWQRLDSLGLLGRNLPILNLIQHVRHAEDWSIQSRYLDRRAIRLCVSEEVAAAVTDAGSEGPVVVIPNSIDVPPQETARDDDRPIDLLIAGLKQPVMAREIGEQMAAPGRVVHLLTEHVPRETFLDLMRRSRVTLFLPNFEEGFYLPALEGMALGTLVVCPDCIGNRSFCLPGINAYRPANEKEDLIRATESALALRSDEADQLTGAALQTARQHSPDAERASFLAVLGDLDALWQAERVSIPGMYRAG